MVPIAYASSEGTDEPAHPQIITSAITAHIHNESACRGCEFRISNRLGPRVKKNQKWLPRK